MLGYYLKLATRSFARTPGLTALMIAAIALGIGICVATLTVYHTMSGNPIWWKSGRLFAVTMDSGNDVRRPYNTDQPQLPPPLLGYRDASALLAAPAPLRKAIMYPQALVISGGDAQAAPRQVAARVTTADFFAMFDVPFLYGGPWSAQADPGAQPVVVLSKEQNDRLFAGRNSTGRSVRIDERDFQVIGVLNTWHPVPRFYDLNSGAFTDPEDIFIPFGWTTVLKKLPSGGTTSCFDERPHISFRDFLNAECIWMQMWVELPDQAARTRMQTFMDNYWAGQHHAGRFPRPRNNRLTDVGQWLTEQGVVSNDSRIVLGLSFAFLGVCLINTVGLLLARFLSTAGVTGMRRALGASRRQIFAQHLTEVGLIAAVGAALGLALAAGALTLLHARAESLGVAGYGDVVRFDMVGVWWALLLAAVSALAAGLYPAWRVGRLPPARYLKSQ